MSDSLESYLSLAPCLSLALVLCKDFSQLIQGLGAVVARYGKVQMVQMVQEGIAASRQICSEPNRLQRSAQQIVPAKVKQIEAM